MSNLFADFEILHESNGVRYVLLPGHLNFMASFPDDPIIFPEEFLICAAFSPDGTLLGRTMWVNLPHIEGTQVKEGLPSGNRIAYNLVHLLEKKIQTVRQNVWAFVQDGDKEVSEYMRRMGYVKLPLEVWVKDKRFDEAGVTTMIKEANRKLKQSQSNKRKRRK